MRGVPLPSRADPSHAAPWFVRGDLDGFFGLAVGFISMEFVLKTFERPLVAFVPLGILLARYLGHARLPGGLPGGLLAVIAGTAIAWTLHWMNWSGAPALGGDVLASVGLHLPVPAIAPLIAALLSPDVWGRISIIVPMGLINVLGSLQSLESAEAEGDAFATGPSLAMNGVATIAAAAFGSCFPTTIYIGHLESPERANAWRAGSG